MSMKPRKFFWLVVVNACLATIFVLSQNCGRVSIADSSPPVEEMMEPASLAVSVSSKLVIPVKANEPVTFSVPTKSNSAQITGLSLKENEVLLKGPTAMASEIQIDPQSWNITYTPSVGLIGTDEVALTVTGSDGSILSIGVQFIITAEDEGQLQDLNALVYGDSADDRTYLQNKLLGYQPPGMSEIFSKWGRFSGNLWYDSASQIVIPSAISFCNSGVNLTTGLFNSAVNPATGKTINPGTESTCVDNPIFGALSWVLMPSPERIFCAANAGNPTGFVSPLNFEYYKHSAVVTSVDRDDDLIGLVIAFVRDQAGVNHILAAARTQGGLNPGLGWGIVYLKNGKVEKVLNNLDIGGVNTNANTAANNPGKGDKLGWNSRMSKIFVERAGDVVTASASNWGTTESSLILSDASKVTLDLSDTKLGLGIFKGAKPYGYLSWSQRASEYRGVDFSNGVNETYVYDLMNKAVYEKQASGKYVVRKDLDAYTHIGAPRLVGNPDTGKIFQLKANKTFQKIK